MDGSGSEGVERGWIDLRLELVYIHKCLRGMAKKRMGIIRSMVFRLMKHRRSSTIRTDWSGKTWNTPNGKNVGKGSRCPSTDEF